MLPQRTINSQDNAERGTPEGRDDKKLSLRKLRRAQIFDAASVVFSSRGFHRATMQEIADAAGLGKGTLYEYVRSKKDLLFLVVEEGHNRLLESIKDIVGKNIPPEEKLLMGIRIQVGFINSYLDAAQVLMPEVEGLLGRDKKRMEELKAAYLDVFRAIYEEGVGKGVFRDTDPLMASEVICNACMLWGKSDMIRKRCPSVRDFEKFLSSLFLTGFKA